MKMTDNWRTFFRQVAVAVVTAVVITVTLIVATRGQVNREREVQDQTLHANLAIACVLALPVRDDGRVPDRVKACFTQYNLPAPEGLRP